MVPQLAQQWILHSSCRPLSNTVVDTLLTTLAVDMPFQGLRRNPLSDSLPDIGARSNFDSPREPHHNITYLHADNDTGRE